MQIAVAIASIVHIRKRTNPLSSRCLINNTASLARKAALAILLNAFMIAGLTAQDLTSDSLNAVYTNAKTDSARVSALIEMGRFKWNSNVNSKRDGAIDIINSALVMASQKKLPEHELKAMNLLGVYYTQATGTKRNAAKGRQLIMQALALARRYGYKYREASLLIDLSSMLNVQSDSAKLLASQALDLSRQYHLYEPEARSLGRLARISERTSDQVTAKAQYLKAIALSREHQLPEVEISNLVNLAELYSVTHQSDSAKHLMQDALTVARQNRLIDLELRVLTFLCSTESGYFSKDSLSRIYDRIKWLTRTYQRDSLPFMSRVAQSYTDMRNLTVGLQIYLDLLHMHKARKDSFGILQTMNGIGLVYQARKDYNLSNAYFTDALNYSSADLFNEIFVHIGLAQNYMKLKKNDSARYYAKEAYRLSITLYGSEANIFGGVLNDIATIYHELGDDVPALTLMRRSYLYFTTRVSQYLNYCHSTLGMAKCFVKAGMQDSSLYYARLCVNTALANSFQSYVSESSELAADYYKARHNIDSAYYYQQLAFDAYRKLYNDESNMEFQNMSFAEQQREKDIALAEKAAAEQYRNNFRLYAVLTVLAVSVLVGVIVFRNNRQQQKSYRLLSRQKREIDLQKEKLETSLHHLTTTQSQLIQSEKMASLGELTAGIAHEIQNPLNFVNNFSEMNAELLTEMKDELRKGNIDQAKSIAEDIISNEQKINHHGKRADAIVKGMLQHSRSSNGTREAVDINALADEYLRLAYHGLRAKDKMFNAIMKTDFDPSVGLVKVVPQDIGRVMLNLITNAFYAVGERKKEHDEKYEPIVTVITKRLGDRVEIRVKDNGNGIPQRIYDKIFQPFFTTKPTGQGTGLGLSLSYDIVKAHGGDLRAETCAREEGTPGEEPGTEFIVTLPV